MEQMDKTNLYCLFAYINDLNNTRFRLRSPLSRNSLLADDFHHSLHSLRIFSLTCIAFMARLFFFAMRSDSVNSHLALSYCTIVHGFISLKQLIYLQYQF